MKRHHCLLQSLSHPDCPTPTSTSTCARAQTYTNTMHARVLSMQTILHTREPRSECEAQAFAKDVELGLAFAPSLRGTTQPFVYPRCVDQTGGAYMIQQDPGVRLILPWRIFISPSSFPVGPGNHGRVSARRRGCAELVMRGTRGPAPARPGAPASPVGHTGLKQGAQMDPPCSLRSFLPIHPYPTTPGGTTWRRRDQAAQTCQGSTRGHPPPPTHPDPHQLLREKAAQTCQEGCS